MEEEIEYLELSDKNQKAINSRLNTEMVKCGTRLIKEKAQEYKTYKKEINLWKKELGQERTKSIKLEIKLAKVSQEQSIMTVICSQATSTYSKNSRSKILDEGTRCSTCEYIPKFFENIQINSASADGGPRSRQGYIFFQKG